MQRTIGVIATCTATKTAPPAVRWTGHDVDEWVEAIATSEPRHQVRDLYAGPAWAAAQRLFDAVPGAETYVASAGLGLATTGQEAPSYDATFVNGTSTSIASGDIETRREGLRRWWAGLCDRSGASLASLAEKSDSVLLVASGPYLDAMHDDLCEAVELAEDRFVVVGVDAQERCSGLKGRTPEFDARVLRKTMLAEALSDDVNRKRLPGGTATLGPVVARDLYRRTGGRISVAAFCDAAQQLMDGLPDAAPHDRAPMDDEELRSWIRSKYDPGQPGRSSYTPLLRLLRATDRACEQSRFRDLFRQVVDDARMR